MFRVELDESIKSILQLIDDQYNYTYTTVVSCVCMLYVCTNINHVSNKIYRNERNSSSKSVSIFMCVDMMVTQNMLIFHLYLHLSLKVPFSPRPLKEQTD